MRLFYAALIYSLLSLSLFTEGYGPIKQKRSLKNDVGKVLLCALATIYKHPFMTCWSMYCTFFPDKTIIEDREEILLGLLMRCC